MNAISPWLLNTNAVLNYGYDKNLPTFFALFPLSNAPNTAAYEEVEVFCTLHDYLRHAQDVEIDLL